MPELVKMYNSGNPAVDISTNVYSRTSMARISLGPWKLVRDLVSLSHSGLIMALVQEANSDNLGKSFRFSTQWLYVEAILMNTHNIHFHDEIRKNS